MDKDHIIREVRRTAQENGGRPLGRQRFLKETGIRETDWVGIHWAKWSEVIEAAGYTPNAKQEPYDEQWIIDQLTGLISKLNRFPTTADMRLHKKSQPDFPSHSAIRRLGNKSQLAALVVQQCEGNGTHDSAIAICKPLASSMPSSAYTSRAFETREDGFVYLIQHGNRREFKIGKTNNPIRREGEIRIEMPAQVTPVHKIKTDDPSGIEAYWHNRFRDKRLRGEWFQLSAEDVRAFKRRKFM
jgi:hypothetical protein